MLLPALKQVLECKFKEFQNIGAKDLIFRGASKKGTYHARNNETINQLETWASDFFSQKKLIDNVIFQYS